MKIYYKSDVKTYLNELIYILFDKEYFSYVDSSKKYILRLITEIKKTIHLKQKYNTPIELKQYGSNYKKFSISKGTTWIIFYDLIKDTYYINYITNNHSANSKYISGLK